MSKIQRWIYIIQRQIHTHTYTYSFTEQQHRVKIPAMGPCICETLVYDVGGKSDHWYKKRLSLKFKPQLNLN